MTPSNEYDLRSSTWPIANLEEVLDALARRCGLARDGAAARGGTACGLRPADGEDLGRWIEALAGTRGIDAEAVEVRYEEVPDLLRRAGPALLRVRVPGGDVGGEVRLLALLPGSGARRLRVLAPDLSRRTIPLAPVRGALCDALEAPFEADVDALLSAADVAGSRRDGAREALLREWLRGGPVRDCWLLRLPPGGNFLRQLVADGIPRNLASLVALHAIQYGIVLAAWVVIGRAALQGRIDRGWLLAWALLLVTVVPLRMAVTWLQGRVSIGAGSLLKRRLLQGSVRLEPDEIRHQGAGALLGRVLESEAVEHLALSGGFYALVSVVEIALATSVIAAGAGGGAAAALFAVWAILALGAAWRFATRLSRWTDGRLAMTHDLVERMVGHRTRLAQEPPELWHAGEDEHLEGYEARSRALDRGLVLLTPLASRGWMALGLLALAPAFVAGRASVAGLAVAVGGVFLGAQALGRLAAGFSFLASAGVAWRQVGPLFRAAGRPEDGSGAARERIAARERVAEPGRLGRMVLEARDLVFRYRAEGEPVLAGCSLGVRAGERVLVQGPSGGGKSTLAAVLTGLRPPSSGLVLAEGLDRATLGLEGWRRRVVASAQFHENHVFAGSLAFNLLMGRRWPPEEGDLEEAEEVCRDLGLGELLDRMPSGIRQTVGETGWQLSHGERSRIYIARSLLQGAGVVILDESFAALDPESLARALECVRRRASTLLVIAHP